MKKVLSDLPILSAVHHVAGPPKDLVIIRQERGVIVVVNAVNPLSVFPLL